MISVLFVDDEPNILKGLKRMLRSMRLEWEMFFANEGELALQMMEEKHFDVIVSDMRMPNMDGAMLLSKVKEKHPETIRIILSGYSETDMIMRSVNTAHQYLAKPCDPEIIRSTVSRAFDLRTVLTDENLQKLVSKMHTVPSMPSLYNKLLNELEKDDPDVKVLGEIIKQDIGMTVKMLQIVNSAFFGLRREITDVTDAIKILGAATIKSLALSLGIFSQFESKKSLAQELTNVWQHSIKVGLFAKKIASEIGTDVANESFTAGLLHDIGKIVMAVNMPEKYKEYKRLLEEEDFDEYAAEKKVFQTTHSAVGAYLLGLWGLPRKTVVAVAFHQLPSEYKNDSFSPATAVHIADVICRNPNEVLSDYLEEYFDMKHLKEVGVSYKIGYWHQMFLESEDN